MNKFVLALSGVSIALVAGPAAAQKDWSKTVVATSDGGVAMGNPKAKVTLVEYGSLTCSHCRDFHAEAMKPLVTNYVKTGKVRFEFRSYLLNAYDVAANLVARCNGAQGFFPAADAFFSTQHQWLGAAQNAPQDKLQALQALPPEQMLPQLASLTGLQKIGATRGIAIAKANQCLADKPAAEQLIAHAEAARAKGVRGTPTFFLNGKMVSGSQWAEVQAALKAALPR